MAGAQRKVSHMEIIKEFTIVLLTCEFLLLALFIENNMGKLHTNSNIHDISKRQYITYLYIKHTDVLGTNFG